MKKKLIAAIIIITAAAAAFYLFISDNPNYMRKLYAQPLAEGSPEEITLRTDDSDHDKTMLYSFIPSKSGEYKFSVTDITCDDDAEITMAVMDRSLSSYLVENSYSGEEDANGRPDVMTGSAYLQAGKKCYISFDASSPDGGPPDSPCSFTFTVMEMTDADKPVSITAGESAEVRITSEGQGCGIAAITSSDSLKVNVTNGICWLNAGKEYHIWLTVDETGSAASQVVLGCSSCTRIKASGKCELTVTGDTVIEYTAGSRENLAVYSVSDGDPAVVIYETPGFPLRNNDNSEGILSDNKNDFGVVFRTESGKTYRICIYGEYTDCKVMIAKYIGDGTTLTREDIEGYFIQGGTKDGVEQTDNPQI